MGRETTSRHDMNSTLDRFHVSMPNTGKFTVMKHGGRRK